MVPTRAIVYLESIKTRLTLKLNVNISTTLKQENHSKMKIFRKKGKI
jgi:hypothetical protein